MKVIKILSIMLIVVCAYGTGVWMGWNTGVHDGQNLMVTTP